MLTESQKNIALVRSRTSVHLCICSVEQQNPKEVHYNLFSGSFAFSIYFLFITKTDIQNSEKCER